MVRLPRQDVGLIFGVMPVRLAGVRTYVSEGKAVTVWVIMDYDEFVAVAATEAAAREHAEAQAGKKLAEGYYGAGAERKFRWDDGHELQRWGEKWNRVGWQGSGFWLIESELIGAETASAGFDSLPAGNGASPDGGRHVPSAAPASDPVPVASGDRADVALCNDCGVDVGVQHDEDCDVARCLVTGLQRLSCGGEHDCGADVWTGKWPGVAECEALDWWAYFVPHTGFVPCPADHPGAVADLNRLVLDGVWDRDAKRWTHPAVARTLDVAEDTAALAKTGVVDGVG